MGKIRNPVASALALAWILSGHPAFAANVHGKVEPVPGNIVGANAVNPAGQVNITPGRGLIDSLQMPQGLSLGAPTPIQLTVPSLTGAAVPNLASTLAPVPSPLQTAAVQPLAVAQPAIVQPQTARAEALPVLPNSALTPTKPQASAGPLKAASSAPDAAPEDGTDAGRILFDQSTARPAEATAASGGLWGKVKNFLSLGEAAPAWPGKAGDVVRVGRIKTKLDKVAGEGGTSKVWKSWDGQYAIKLIHPDAMTIPGVRDEAAILRAISETDLPVAKLIAESRDGKVLVKEFIEGSTAHEILARGAFSRSQAEGWPELAAKLIKSGVTADLAHGNLVWRHWRTKWVIVDGGSLTDGSPKAVLDQMLTPELLSRTGLDPVKFLSGLRARLGPDSALWAKTLEALKSSKAGTSGLAALARQDAAAKAGPVLSFGPAPKGPAGLDDTIVSGSEVNKRLGFDPFRTKTKIKLHGDDPGKLNTVLQSIEEPGKPKIVMKTASWDIIRSEVAVRRLARRFFGRYFRTPGSLAVKHGYDSYMVMEKASASPAYYGTFLNLEQRVAAALFIHTFGINDVNPGNVLMPSDGGLPWLIDFEQAFGRSEPVAGRIPDEGIAREMPWMSRVTRNLVEDYQPGIRAWRTFLAKPETRTSILNDLAASGFPPAEAAALLARFDRNAADLDWTLQNDADFVNQFMDRNAAQR